MKYGHSERIVSIRLSPEGQRCEAFLGSDVVLDLP
jgi:hypothetical protein